ncbi:MAG: transcription elongation factor GreB [Gammaproteobacteria bacterium]|nr:transcription elongation factor GreB [Gammaproteobacteria bacterium]
MGRYRPPAKPQAPYITPEGAKALRDELDRLWRVDRPAVTRAVSEAAAQGDRSENAEYIYGKKQLYAIDRRVRYLQKRLDVLKIVDSSLHDEERAYFGAWLRVDTGGGSVEIYRIVGPDELSVNKQYISVESPLARAVLGKALGDEFVLERPAGPTTCVLLEVSYKPFD